MWWLLSWATAAPLTMVVTAEPIRGDDRVATRLETALRGDAPALLACRAEAEAAGADPLRYLQADVKLRAGSPNPRRVRVASATGDDRVDACTVARIKVAAIDPPPAYGDRILVAITWVAPTP